MRLLRRGGRRFAWPVVLREEDVEARGLASGASTVVLRPLVAGDEQEWTGLRLADDARLTPWEATLPPGSGEVLEDFPGFVRRQRRLALEGESMPFVVEVDGVLAGQVTVAPIAWGSLRSASVGYWIGGRWRGTGVAGLAVAMCLDHLLGPEVGLHRVEANVRPENARSLALCRRLGMREEGLRRSFMHINGRWADHVSFAVLAEEVPAGGVVGRLRRV